MTFHHFLGWNFAFAYEYLWKESIAEGGGQLNTGQDADTTHNDIPDDFLFSAKTFTYNTRPYWHRVDIPDVAHVVWITGVTQKETPCFSVRRPDLSVSGIVFG